MNKTSEVFKSANSTTAHDSRYDIVATFMCWKKGVEMGLINSPKPMENIFGLNKSYSNEKVNVQMSF